MSSFFFFLQLLTHYTSIHLLVKNIKAWNKKCTHACRYNKMTCPHLDTICNTLFCLNIVKLGVQLLIKKSLWRLKEKFQEFQFPIHYTTIIWYVGGSDFNHLIMMHFTAAVNNKHSRYLVGDPYILLGLVWVMQP